MTQKKRRREIAASNRKAEKLLEQAKAVEAAHARLILRGIVVGAIAVYPRTNEVGICGIRYSSDRDNWKMVVEAVGLDNLRREIESLEKINGFKLKFF